MRRTLGYFTGSFAFTGAGLALGALLGWRAHGTAAVVASTLLVIAVLGVLETSISFDNAVVNATVLRDMSPLWRRRFLTWGIAIAVFDAPRLPVAVSAVAHIGPGGLRSRSSARCGARRLERARQRAPSAPSRHGLLGSSTLKTLRIAVGRRPGWARSRRSRSASTCRARAFRDYPAGRATVPRGGRLACHVSRGGRARWRPDRPGVLCTARGSSA
jgi:hypothetical protein